MHIEPYHRTPQSKELKVEKHLHQKRMDDLEARIHNNELEMEQLHLILFKIQDKLFNDAMEKKHG